MSPRKVLCPLAAALVLLAVLVPALPAGAVEDTVPPRSMFTTQDNAMVLRSPVYNGVVEGDSSDDSSGLLGILIQYCNSAFCQYRFEQNLCYPDCPAPLKQHWTFQVPPDGTWRVNIRAVDAAGNMEEPGPFINISVLPVDVPTLEWPALPVFDQLPPIPSVEELPPMLGLDKLPPVPGLEQLPIVGQVPLLPKQ